MITDREVLLSILKLTEGGKPTTVEAVIRSSRVPSQSVYEAVERLVEENLIEVTDGTIEITGELRLRAAVKAIKMGVDLERVCNLLTWAEFEDLSALAFEMSGFSVRRGLRFRWSGRRWEVDILAWMGETVISVDCKHWRRNWRRSAIIRIVEAHIGRTKALAEALPIKGVTMNMRGRFVVVPVILSLIPGPLKFHMGVPIVPILQLRDFISEMPAHIGSMKHFTRVIRGIPDEVGQ